MEKPDVNGDRIFKTHRGGKMYQYARVLCCKTVVLQWNVRAFNVVVTSHLITYLRHLKACDLKESQS